MFSAAGGTVLILPAPPTGEGGREAVERLKGRIKAMVDRLADEKKLRLVQAELEEGEYYQELERRLAEVERRQS
jgi:hypothetical protein